ncbi:MAG: EAL domain-containing protein [Clostridia bacterium]|nr:EAL domain-containing protein [Clostridia bacterium]
MTIPVSINLSRVDVFDPDLERNIDHVLSRAGLDHSVLKIEITETAYTENADRLINVVKRLRDDGFSVAMDDFGTGYSSLSMLSAMPVDIIKMDAAFVRNIENSKKDTLLVALIMDIAKDLDVPVIAEGVETESQIKMLRELGCPLVQGYYFSRPLHPDAFEAQILSDVRPQ